MNLKSELLKSLSVHEHTHQMQTNCERKKKSCHGRLLFDQSGPAHLCSESFGGNLSLTQDGQTNGQRDGWRDGQTEEGNSCV